MAQNNYDYPFLKSNVLITDQINNINNITP